MHAPSITSDRPANPQNTEVPLLFFGSKEMLTRVEASAPLIPEGIIEARELRQAIAESLQTLTQREQDILERIYFDGQNVKDIACEVDVSESYIRQIRERALRKLRHRDICLRLLKAGAFDRRTLDLLHAC